MGDSEVAAARLRRIEGQVRGIRQMLAEGQPCENVITQVMEARAALDEVALRVMADQVEECLRDRTSLEQTKDALERSLTLFLRMSPGVRKLARQVRIGSD